MRDMAGRLRGWAGAQWRHPRAGRRLAGTALVAGAALWFWNCLPQPLFAAPLSSAVYDRDGALLGARIADDGQWRFAPPQRVPDKLAAAMVRFEDKRYYHHPGVDPVAVARAAWLNLRRGEVVSGGSTLTMQVVRLARGNPPRTLREKAAEAAMALRLELGHGKQEILALYAANAPYGGNVVGVEAAAWRYFGHSPEQLSWAEATTLAVLPNSPALIHPGRGRVLLKAKRDRLLEALHGEGAIDDLSYQLALAEPLPGAPLALPRMAPHLLDTLAAQEAGTRVRTTLSQPLQAAVSRRVDAAVARLSAQGVHNAAALVIDNRDMSVLAYAGNRSDLGETERGYAVDLVRRPRSTGSLLKPFLFAAMVQDGALAPASLVPDVPMHFTGFEPENFDKTYRGAVRAREALAQSLNVPAVFMLREHGVERFYDELKQLGMSTLFRAPDGYGLTLVLGGSEGTLWDLAQMYANLARISESGRSRAAVRQAALRLRADQPLQETRGAPFGAGAAYLTLDALQEVSRPEIDRNWRSFDSSRKLAWKTGTSYGLRDGWAIGVTPRHTIAVWVGNASGEGQAGLTGAGMAAPLMFEILDELPQDPWFRQPGMDLRQVALCRDDGYLPVQGCATELQWLPAGGRFQVASRNHQTVPLDAAGLWRVHSGCESVSRMQYRSWFVLPPRQEYWYRQRESGYRQLPRYRADCQRLLDAEGGRPFDIVYPEAGAKIFIPTDLGGTRGRVVLEAVHSREDAKLFWHLDGEYVGETGPFHKLALDLPAGEHRLTLVDGDGNRQVRSFTVLPRGQS